ncbi:MAG: hypothetical protein Q8L48_31010 [Archangium sp.]|nr:hypothetical protein [Archangium sp.]
MDRRDVLKLGAVASLGGSGCATLLSNPSAVGAGDMGGFLSSLDTALDGIGKGSFFERFLPTASNPAVAEKAKHGEALTKKTLRSLLLVGTLQELPPEQLAHEGVQQRLRDSMGEFDDAMFGMTSMLEGLSPTERAEVSKALQEDPQLGMRVMGAIDDEAAGFGVSLKQRTRLRALSSHTCARLRRSPELTLTEYTGKMHKVAARHGARSSAERNAAAIVGSSLIWQGQPGEGGGVAPATGGLTPPPPPPPQADQPEARGTDFAPAPATQGTPVAPPARKGPRASHVVLTAGGIALGLGATLVGIGFATSTATQGVSLALGLTFGALLGIAGIITLIIGLVLLAAGK